MAGKDEGWGWGREFVRCPGWVGKGNRLSPYVYFKLVLLLRYGILDLHISTFPERLGSFAGLAAEEYSPPEPAFPTGTTLAFFLLRHLLLSQYRFAKRGDFFGYYFGARGRRDHSASIADERSGSKSSKEGGISARRSFLPSRCSFILFGRND